MPVEIQEIVTRVEIQESPTNQVTVTTPGPQGPQGPAATVNVGAVTTLGPDANATVVNVGTDTAAVLDFGIPKGEPGQGFIESGPFVVSEGSDADLLGEAWNSAEYNMVDYVAKVLRGTSAFVRVEFTIFYRNGGWELAFGGERYHDSAEESGVDFTVDSATGQINAENLGVGDVTIYLQKNRWST